MRQEARELTRVMCEANPGSFLGYYIDQPRLHIKRPSGEIIWDGVPIGTLRISGNGSALVEFDAELLEGSTVKIEEIITKLRRGGEPAAAGNTAAESVGICATSVSPATTSNNISVSHETPMPPLAL